MRCYRRSRWIESSTDSVLGPGNNFLTHYKLVHGVDLHELDAGAGLSSRAEPARGPRAGRPWSAGRGTGCRSTRHAPPQGAAHTPGASTPLPPNLRSGPRPPAHARSPRRGAARPSLVRSRPHGLVGRPPHLVKGQTGAVEGAEHAASALRTTRACRNRAPPALPPPPSGGRGRNPTPPCRALAAPTP